MSSEQREITLKFLAEPTDVNFGGKVHGGVVMKWIDLAAYACAAGWSGKYCVTVYAGGIRFVAPVQVGQLVEVKAQIIHTGSSSMHVGLTVKASDPTSVNNKTLTTHCIVIMVAVDENGKPTKVPQWIPESARDIKLHQSALRLMEMRKQIGEEMEAHVLEDE
ncbi:acyl-CoA thioesterase [Vibrio sp. SS-MA-C1-2]|uniref:acyl-CoA thioesterase n=1 Tax=Vibrio sp. SS-MA-C1-2 TaxID=2908646 RepID=UPI001F1EDDA1|nr:acyl-CoA thioesterase [Vibrio sp. SS-MA-C1-2]UJF17192.1 acyl-CoA thioesterase [Vibrio sp. SS-MA-C1-2]